MLGSRSWSALLALLGIVLWATSWVWIEIGLDESSRKFVVPVAIEVEPHIVRTKSGEQIDLRDRETLRRLVERGLRARLRLQSILTGQLYVDLDFHPDKPARFVATDPEVSEIPTVRTAVQELTSKLEGFPMDKFLADVAAIGTALSKTLDTPEVRNLPRRLDATLKHLESLAARLDAKSGPILEETRSDLAEMKKALADIEKMEDTLYGSLDKAVADAAKNLQGPWAMVLEGMKARGSATGSSATAALEQLTERSREAVRRGRAQAQSTVDAWMDHYTALARGVLIGMSEGLDASAPPPAAKSSSRRARQG